jgi:hypothetical protein
MSTANEQPNPEEVDLAELALAIEVELRDVDLAGYVRGQTAIRELVARHLHASDVLAENVVETMIGQGFLSYLGDPSRTGDEGRWRARRS